MSHQVETVRDLLSTVNIHENVAAALHDQSPRWSDGYQHIVPDWSPLFNAVTACYEQLQQDSTIELTDKPIKLDPTLTALGKIVVGLLNQSLTRKPTAYYQFNDRPMRVYDCCTLAEQTLYDSLGDETNEGFGYSPHTLHTVFVDEDCQPVLFRKGVSALTSLSFATIAVNGIDYPAGTFFDVSDWEEKPYYEDSNFNVVPLKSIERIQPIRLSLLGLPPSERMEAFLRKDKTTKQTGLVEGLEQERHMVDELETVEDFVAQRVIPQFVAVA